VDEYAAELRRRTSGTRREQGDTAALVDRLLVGALIEARSCERFKLLAEAASSMPEHAALQSFWTELLATEARHYRTFVDLAERAAGGDRSAVQGRLEVLAGVEGALVRELARRGEATSRATIHG
jgi:tRNA-(ms[2]io[6]A)-hydroxylase